MNTIPPKKLRLIDVASSAKKLGFRLTTDNKGHLVYEHIRHVAAVERLHTSPRTAHEASVADNHLRLLGLMK